MKFYFVAIALFSTSILAATQESSNAFVNELGNDVISILRNKHQSMAVRKSNFRKEIREHFDLPSIGKFIIARYWRRMNDAQHKKYISLFEDAVIENYASQFDNYKQQSLVITGSQKTKDGGTVISSEIRTPGKGTPLHIKWKVFKTSRGLKVLDVIVENVSMSLTLRNEYSSVISSRGGKVDSLFVYLKDKINEDREENRKK